MYPLLAIPGGWELVLIVLVLIMLFGAKKLPELARGSGQALKIFKDETKGLREDGQEKDAEQRPSSTHAPGQLESSRDDAPRLGEERNDGTTA